eukprot:4192618-Alexandrium_andersonii.AAC.1
MEAPSHEGGNTRGHVASFSAAQVGSGSFGRAQHATTKEGPARRGKHNVAKPHAVDATVWPTTYIGFGRP